MIPIQDLLHRIQWDPASGGSVFELGYLDRVGGRIVRVPFGAVRVTGGARPALTVIDDDGAVVTVPLHRVREVWRDGTSIWSRRPR